MRGVGGPVDREHTGLPPFRTPILPFSRHSTLVTQHCYGKYVTRRFGGKCAAIHALVEGASGPACRPLWRVLAVRAREGATADQAYLMVRQPAADLLLRRLRKSSAFPSSF